MQLIRDICSGPDCGILLPIVNMKYNLCDSCNFKRLHYGKSREDVYRERIDQRARTKFTNQSAKKSLHDIVKINSADKSKNKIRSVSIEKRYYCSDGSLVSQADIQMYLKVCHDKIRETRLPFCEGTGRTDLPLSFSHTISQARCKELRKTELIWSEDNICIESMEPPCSYPTAGHNIWEVGSIQMKMELKNFYDKLAFIKIHDSEEYNRLEIKIEELNVRKRD